MTVDSALLIAFLAAFLRTSAMMLAAPLFTGTGVPLMVRIFFSAGLSLALTPIVHQVVVVPQDLHALLMLAVQEIAYGLVLGFCVQLIMLAAESAGSFLDLQVGFGLASVLAPGSNIPGGVIARFKFLLALVLFVSVNGHHMMFQALAAGYQVSHQMSLNATFETVLLALGRMSILAIQIAAPVAAVMFVVDACMGIVSRAVPQINVLMAGISGKILVGMVGLSVSLPALAIGVNRAIGWTGDTLVHLFAR